MKLEKIMKLIPILYLIQLIVLCVQGKNLHLQNDEFAMSKDPIVCLWMDYRKYYGESLREVLRGNL